MEFSNSYALKLLFLSVYFVFSLHTTNQSTSGNNADPTLPTEVKYTKSEIEESVIDNTTSPPTASPPSSEDDSYIQICPENTACHVLGGECITCQFNKHCHYGANVTANCTSKPNISCIEPKTFVREYQCRYCYQLDPSFYTCNTSSTCTVISSPRKRFITTCKVKDNVLCLGKRTFKKSLLCNWTSGYKWSTAFLLSVTLGGFGVDRFYLGLWREGIGKLFSFGGLGVWTLVDVILIGVGYIGPADGSVYI